MRSLLTVVTPARTRDLTTLETLKTELGITKSEMDQKLQMLITRASVVIAEYCDRVFGKESLLQNFWPIHNERRAILALDRKPVLSVTSVTENGVALTADDYLLDPASGHLRRRREGRFKDWPAGQIDVAYDAGYVLLDDVPYSLETACLSLARTYYFAGARDPLVRRETTPGVLDQTFWVGGLGANAALPPDVVSLLDNYRSVYMG